MFSQSEVCWVSVIPSYGSYIVRLRIWDKFEVHLKEMQCCLLVGVGKVFLLLIFKVWSFSQFSRSNFVFPYVANFMSYDVLNHEFLWDQHFLCVDFMKKKNIRKVCEKDLNNFVWPKQNQELLSKMSKIKIHSFSWGFIVKLSQKLLLTN